MQAVQQQLPANSAAGGFYCSTSGTYFHDKESLTEHYKSDFHRYNLKRKVAGLPPVTREWFEARRAQLAGAAGGAATAAPVSRVWTDPLTKKKFSSENTYHNYVTSKKYRDLLRKEGLSEPPQPVVTLRRNNEDAVAAAPAAPRAAAAGGGGGFTVKPAVKQGGALEEGVREVAQAQDHASDMGDDEDDADDGSSGWETASDDDVAAMEAEQGDWEEWDVRHSLFDGHVAASMEANLEYMFKKYGFYLPDVEYLVDPTGMLQYLGHKLQYGRVPLYTRGDDANAKQFRSLHAVQRHMIDSGKTKLLYDGNEEEYEDFYDYSRGEETERDELGDAGPHGRELVLADADESPAGLAAGGYELVLAGNGAGSSSSSGTKVLGSRDLAIYYRQRHRPADARASVVANAVVVAYKQLGVDTREAGQGKGGPEAVAGRRAKAEQNRLRMKAEIRNDKIFKLPKNCTH